MPYTRVFEDFDTPGEGQPFFIDVMVDLVDAQTKVTVKEAYFEGRTIAGVTKAPINGGSVNWWNQTHVRAQWELPLAPNSQIVYKGSPGGTYWRRSASSRSPFASPSGTIKKTRAYIDVPESTDRLIFGDLVAPNEDDMPSVDHAWDIVAGDRWSRDLSFSNPDPDNPEVSIPEDKSDFTLELELRRSWRDGVVRASAAFDYTNAATGSITMSLDSATTLPLFGMYYASLQQYDTDEQRTTLSTWSFNFEADR